jgi:hypothetical protein
MNLSPTQIPIALTVHTVDRRTSRPRKSFSDPRPSPALYARHGESQNDRNELWSPPKRVSGSRSPVARMRDDRRHSIIRGPRRLLSPRDIVRKGWPENRRSRDSPCATREAAQFPPDRMTSADTRPPIDGPYFFAFPPLGISVMRVPFGHVVCRCAVVRSELLTI